MQDVAAGAAADVIVAAAGEERDRTLRAGRQAVGTRPGYDLHRDVLRAKGHLAEEDRVGAVAEVDVVAGEAIRLEVHRVIAGAEHHRDLVVSGAADHRAVGVRAGCRDLREARHVDDHVARLVGRQSELDLVLRVVVPVDDQGAVVVAEGDRGRVRGGGALRGNSHQQDCEGTENRHAANPPAERLQPGFSRNEARRKPGSRTLRRCTHRTRQPSCPRHAHGRPSRCCSASPSSCSRRLRRSPPTTRCLPGTATRARSRPMARPSAGATTTTGRRRSRPARHGHPDQRRRPPHMRDQDRRHPGLLGRRQHRADRPSRPGPAPSPRSPPAAATRARSRPTAPPPAGATTTPAAPRSRRLAASPRSPPATLHTCAIKTGGTPICWGTTAPGRRRSRPASAASRRSPPAPCTRARSRPTAHPVCWGNTGTIPDGTGTLTQINAGGSHTCAIKTNGTPTCWGNNFAGQSTIPAGIESVTQITAGSEHTCAMRTGGTPVCWGDNTDGQTTVASGIGTGDSDHRRLLHSCAIKTDATPICWGSNEFEQAVVPAGIGAVTQISIGLNDTCAITTSGRPTCWGGTGYGIGFPDAAVTVTQITSGMNHICAIKTNGTPICWGHNFSGEGTVPAGHRHRHPDQRRLLTHMRDQDRRHGDLLGVRRDGPGRPRHRHADQRRRTRRPARSRPTAPPGAGATMSIRT